MFDPLISTPTDRAAITDDPPQLLRCPTPRLQRALRLNKFVQAPCAKQSCPACGPVWRLGRSRVFLSGVQDRPPSDFLLVTLTGPSFAWDTYRDRWNKEGAKQAWDEFLGLLASHGRSTGWKPAFFRVTEMQKERFAIHFHVVLRDCPFSAQKIAELAKRAGFGDAIRIDECYDLLELWGYLSKESLDPKPWFLLRKAVFTQSRNWCLVPLPAIPRNPDVRPVRVRVIPDGGAGQWEAVWREDGEEHREVLPAELVRASRDRPREYPEFVLPVNAPLPSTPPLDRKEDSMRLAK